MNASDLFAGFSAAGADRLLASSSPAPSGRPESTDWSRWDETEGRWRSFRGWWDPTTERYTRDVREVRS